MAATPNLRIIIDGDSSRVFRRGDQVTGRVILSVEQEQAFGALSINFAGTCTTKTTRPIFINGNDVNATQREHEERIRLFSFEQKLFLWDTVVTRKYCSTFAFKFPELTAPKYARWQHGPKYLKDPHALPPSFQTYTNAPGGHAMVSYLLLAKLEMLGGQTALKIHEPLPYHPTPHDLPLEAKITSRVLYAQTWKPMADSRTAIDKAFSKISRRTTTTNIIPRIVPTLHYPERISPGQHIPLLISLANAQELPAKGDAEQAQECVLDSVSVIIGTHTASVCGQLATSPEDTMTRYVPCMSKTGLNTPIPFGARTKLTGNFRLIDDIECVPSFKTYTIARRYDLAVTVGIRYGEQKLTVRCTTTLDILPRIPQDLLPLTQESGDNEIDPLPLYMPREPSKEFAPDYNFLYSLSRTSSSTRSSAYTESGGCSAASSGHSTPASELDQMDFRELPPGYEDHCLSA